MGSWQLSKANESEVKHAGTKGSFVHMANTWVFVCDFFLRMIMYLAVGDPVVLGEKALNV